MVELIEDIKIKIQQYNYDVNVELHTILNYWMQHAVDTENGGFYGRMDNNNRVDKLAAKGAVLNARILWTFSAAYQHSKNDNYKAIAERAFNYIKDHFIDKEFGGVYWAVNAYGNPLNTRKQIYALAFCIYGLSEYYAATKNETALHLVNDLYNTIEKHSYDANKKGYAEAFAKDWSVLSDLRLSAKDANEKKTTNTHLHILEAYANLYKVFPNENLKSKISEILFSFDEYIIDHNTYHLKLFFDENWNEKPDIISYGHDIEAAWLLQQCAEIINDEHWTDVFKSHAVNITDAVMKGLDDDGGLWYEYDPSNKHLVTQKHWWPQAEAMIGFFNAYQITGNNIYLDHSIASWHFIKKHLVDSINGEWFWGINKDYTIMNEDKIGLWKCPYHNSRACLEIINRIQNF